MNLHAFGRANPVNLRDPSGLCFGGLLGGIGEGESLEADEAAAAGAGMTLAERFALQIALRNRMLTAIIVRASTMGPRRALDFLIRAEQLVTDTVGRVFSPSTYRQGYEWFMGGLEEGYQVHHIFPQKFAEWFEAKGININMPTWLVEVETKAHQSMSAGYNKLWEQFIREKGLSATIDEIFDFARDAMAQWGLEVPW